MAITHFAPQEASNNIGAQHPIYHQFLFRDACKSLLMIGRPCLAGGGHRPGPVPGDLLPPLLLTKLVSPLFVRLSSPRPTVPVFPLQPPPYVYMYQVMCTTPIETLLSRLIHMHQVACTTPIKTLL